MTVAELIQILQTLPADQEVRIQHPYLDETAELEDVLPSTLVSSRHPDAKIKVACNGMTICANNRKLKRIGTRRELRNRYSKRRRHG